MVANLNAIKFRHGAVPKISLAFPTAEEILALGLKSIGNGHLWHVGVDVVRGKRGSILAHPKHAIIAHPPVNSASWNMKVGRNSPLGGQYEFIDQEKGKEFYDYLGQGKYEFTKKISD